MGSQHRIFPDIEIIKLQKSVQPFCLLSQAAFLWAVYLIRQKMRIQKAVVWNYPYNSLLGEGSSCQEPSALFYNISPLRPKLP